MKIQVIDGDITLVAADALIAAINSGGHAAGGVDLAICRKDNRYHMALQDQLEKQSLRELDTFVAKAPPRTTLPFGDIVFVIDDTKRPLRKVVESGLWVAHDLGKSRVCMPVFRSGVALGKRERAIGQIAEEYAAGIAPILGLRKLAITNLTIVTFQDPTAMSAFKKKLGE